MGRKKAIHFEHNINSRNVVERGKTLYSTIKGKWRSDFFKNDHPIVLELACGKGEYSVGFGEQYPEKNFIGIDIKGDRIARGSRRAIEKKLDNVCFLRTGIQFLSEFFEENEVDEIWLIHPDPQPRDKEEKRRLTNHKFLEIYASVLKTNGLLHLKTDSDFLFSYSLSSIESYDGFKITESTPNLYTSDLYVQHHGIVTHYEKLFVEKGHIISYIECKKESHS